MSQSSRALRVLFSFPHRLGADRICYTAWQQVNGLAAAGAKVLAFPASVQRSLPASVTVRPTLAWRGFRLPYRAIGSRNAFAIHDAIVAYRLARLADAVDVVHVWPQGALRTINVAKRLGIPVVLERPNAHTRYAYEVVRAECERLGVALPADHEHAFNADVLRVEEAEFAAADWLLCPSDFVRDTFLQQDYPAAKLLRHQYGFDEKKFFPNPQSSTTAHGLRAIFVGGCAPRKGLHFAVQAWLASRACANGTFTIVGTFLSDYHEYLRPLLSHPSIKVLGQRSDIPELMRASDVLLLPSIEEGSALVTAEARGSGCVLLVSTATGAICNDQVDSLVHDVGDIATLTSHLDLLASNRRKLNELRAESLRTAGCATWASAGSALLDAYRTAVQAHALQPHRERLVERWRDA